MLYAYSLPDDSLIPGKATETVVRPDSILSNVQVDGVGGAADGPEQTGPGPAGSGPKSRPDREKEAGNWPNESGKGHRKV